MTGSNFPWFKLRCERQMLRVITYRLLGQERNEKGEINTMDERSIGKMILIGGKTWLATKSIIAFRIWGSMSC